MVESPNTSRRLSGALNKAGNTGKLISSYYLEVEYLIERITSSSTHYQVLGLEQSAANEVIVKAYQEAVQLLHSRNRKVRTALPDELYQQIDKSFERASDAFLILTDPDKRLEYDKTLRRGGPRVTPLVGALSDTPAVPSKPATKANTQPEITTPKPEYPKRNGNEGVLPASRLAEPIKPRAPGSNRRRADRIKLAIPALVLGHDRNGGKWKEITKTIDVSRNGAAILMSRRLRHGLVVQLRLPMPVRLRCHGHTEPGYKVYAIVRRVELPGDDGNRVIGMEFLGEQPPPGYLEKPWAAYRSERWTGADRRREPREVRSEQVFVEYLDNSENLIKREKAFTEDISRGGVRLILRPNAPDIDLVRVANADNSFSCLAAVRNRFIDDDGRERLCLKLIGKEWPL